MSTNTAGSAVRTVVQNASLKYRSLDYVWPEVFPRLPLETVKQKIWVWNKGDQFRIPSDQEILRTAGTESWRWNNKGEYVSVDAKEKSVGTEITDQDLRNEGLQAGSMPPTDMQIDAVEQNADIIDRWTEKKVNDTIIAQTWADGVSGGEDAAGLWSPTGSTNTFVPDVLGAIDTLRKKGVPPNELRLLVDFTTFMKLKRVDELKNMITDTQTVRPTDISASMIANALGVNALVIAGSIYSSAQEKQDGTDFTAANIWDTANSKGMGFLYHFPPVVKRKMLATGVVATLPQLGGQFRENMQWYEPNKKQRIFETTEENEVKILATDTGYLWKDTHTT